MAQFWVFGPKPAPLVPHLIMPSQHLNLSIPPPNMVSSIQNQAPMAHFHVFFVNNIYIIVCAPVVYQNGTDSISWYWYTLVSVENYGFHLYLHNPYLWQVWCHRWQVQCDLCYTLATIQEHIWCHNGSIVGIATTFPFYQEIFSFPALSLTDWVTNSHLRRWFSIMWFLPHMDCTFLCAKCIKSHVSTSICQLFVWTNIYLFSRALLVSVSGSQDYSSPDYCHIDRECQPWAWALPNTKHSGEFCPAYNFSVSIKMFPGPSLSSTTCRHGAVQNVDTQNLTDSTIWVLIEILEIQAVTVWS